MSVAEKEKELILNLSTKARKEYGGNLDLNNMRAFKWDILMESEGQHWKVRGESGDLDYKEYYQALLNLMARAYPERNDPLLTTKLAKQQWGLLEKAKASGRHILVHGRPGTGKSRSVYELARSTQRRLDVINMRPNLPVDPLVGHYIPNKEGYFSFMYGVISMAMKEGGLLLVNEIDHATGDAESIMHFALDDPSVASVTLPNEEREIIRPEKGYQVVATMNGVASTDLSAPIYSRFGCKVRIDFPNPDAVEFLDVDLRPVAMADYRNVQADRVIPDLRMLFAFQEMRKTMDPKTAAALVFEAQGEEFLSTITKAA